MENNLAIIGTKENLADIMGMSNTVPSSRSALAEIKQVHQNIMGTKEVDGENMEVAVIKACLLYTSPSPRDRTRSRMPSSA